MTSTHAPAAHVRRAYVNQAAISYSIYLVGATSAFVAVTLSLSDTEAGLHSSAMASGMIVAGVAGERFDGLLDAHRSHLVGMGLLVVSLLVLAWAPVLAVTLVASLGIGLGAGMMFGHVNQTLGAGGGAQTRVQLGRSALVAKTSQIVVPIAIGAGIAVGLGWQFVMVPVMALVGVLFVAMRSNREEAVVHPEMSRLPWAYWLPWILAVLVIAVEFFVIVWGGSLVERQTGVSLADATLAISVFIAGLILARVVMSFPAMGGLDPMLVIRLGIVVSLVAVLVPWLSGSYLLSAAGLFVAGFGIGALYPPAASMALAAVPAQSAAASARLVSAAGVAILVAPLLLGIVADSTSITAAWLLIPSVCAGALLLTIPVETARRARERTTA